ncbi:NAD(P)H-dependent flavin oxidoreductase [Klebsiella quasipneumoniae]|uniref:NAD(P)H-dependent flavin oxidoreductase n=1 Tax=Klebsiella quasipneumoniae TaxID=1463165 RepID=UPI0021672939|nr:nitronate monooxygenase [Klebsiella quasipneumoniae]MCS4426865.1 nitronate monooxygenase [Klebsiella quasipneumoniae subsp. similipneumoniae]
MQTNRVARILGIEKPVVQGPLSWLTDARLVAAVGNAGGLGVLGPNAGLTAATAVSTPEATAEKMREEIRKTKQLTEKPFGVNLIPTAENDIWTPAILPVIKEEGVKVVVYTGYGDGSLKPALFDELKTAGITIIYRDINPTPENSRRAEQAGADIIVANGLDLRLFRTLPDYYRALPGKLSDKLVAMDRAGASKAELAQAMGGLRGMRLGMLEGNTDEGYISLGAGIGNIHAIASVAEVVNQLAV